MLWQVFLSTCAVGCAFHFLYAPLGKPRFLRWLLPIGESPWEHFKLVFWPMGGGLAAAAWLTEAAAGAWVCAWVVAAGHGFCTMTGIYYFYRGALGVTRPLLWVDISNYFITMFCGWVLGLPALACRPGWEAVLPAAVALAACAAAFALFSEEPPAKPLFREENRK